MQTTSLENVDFYVDEDFAVVYVEATPQQTPREDIREEITNVALELLPYATDTIQVQKPLDGRLQHIEKPHSPAFLPHTLPNTSIPYPLSLPPPEALNSMDIEPITTKENTPGPLLEETDQKIGVENRNCCDFFQCFFKKKGLNSTKKI